MTATRSRRYASLAVGILLAVGIRDIGAQSNSTSEREDLRILRGDAWHVITSPVRADRGTIAPVLGSVAVIAAATPFDSVIFAWMQANPRAPPMRAIAPVRENFRLPFYELGSALYLIPISGALYAGGRMGDDHNLRDAGLGCMAAELSSSALRVLIQFTVNRDRPRESLDPGHVSGTWNRKFKGHSFPSGHVANPMACASFVARRFSLGAAEPAMMVYVGALAAARIADGQHWASDVIAGAVMGAAIGKAIADRQHQRWSAGRRPGARRSGVVHLPALSFTF